MHIVRLLNSPFDVYLGSKEVFVGLGRRHVLTHFPSSDLLTAAIQHQLQVLVRKIDDNVGIRRKLIVDAVEFNQLFLTCWKFTQHISLSKRFNKIETISALHITFVSANENLVCAIVFVKNDIHLTQLNQLKQEMKLSVLIPIPSILKMDESIVHAIDWAMNKYDNIQSKNDEMKIESMKVFTHPILRDVVEKKNVDISIIFRPSWSNKSQEESLNNWLSQLKGMDIGISERYHYKKRWNDFYWTGDTSDLDKGISNRKQNSSYMRSILSDSIELTTIYERIKSLHPFSDAEQDTIREIGLTELSIKERWQRWQQLQTLHDNWRLIY